VYEKFGAGLPHVGKLLGFSSAKRLVADGVPPEAVVSIVERAEAGITDELIPSPNSTG
jgi:hypothetical protein